MVRPDLVAVAFAGPGDREHAASLEWPQRTCCIHVNAHGAAGGDARQRSELPLAATELSRKAGSEAREAAAEELEDTESAEGRSGGRAAGSKQQ